jgi:biotin synthase
MAATEEIVSSGRDAAARGAGCFGIVTSGPDPGGDADLDAVCGAARELSKHLDVCASLGRLTAGQVKRLADAGVRRIHHNLETARSFFSRVCTTHSYDDRIETVRAVTSAGVEACCGGLMGLGETWRQRVELALELRELGVGSVPINFLNPIPGTPCERAEPITPLDALKIIALFRFVLPRAAIKTAGGRERTLRDLQAWMFYAGANSTMIGNYLTTPGRPPEEDLRLIADLGLRVARRPERTKP